jgi:hypothetical protein
MVVMNEQRLGVDFGRVINDGASHPGGDDTVFLSGGHDDAMRTPAMPGAIEVLAELVTRFDGNVWIVSKCGERIQRRTLDWLEHHDLYGRTGLPRGNVRFCRRRPEKALHCEELGITHFIDDRLDVLTYLRGLVPNLYLFGRQTEPVPAWVTHLPSWDAVSREMSGTSRVRTS